LLCSPVTPNISSNTSNVASWLGGKNCSTLAINGYTADPRKYAEIQRWYRSKIRYTNLMKRMWMWTIHVQLGSVRTEKGCH
jgi:hypothetical protein